jgi:hypothetical protein
MDDKTLNNLINQLHINSDNAKLKKSDNLESIKEQLEFITNSPSLYLVNKIDNEINQIDIKREEEIQLLDQYYSSFIGKLNKYKEECLILIQKQNKENKTEHDNTEDKIETKIRSEQELEMRLQMIQNKIQMNKVFKFEVEKIVQINNRSYYGALTFKANCLNSHNFKSNIIKTDQFRNLLELTSLTNKTNEDEDEDVKFNLIYRSSIDGTKCENFHKKCDGFSKTLTIIKTKDSFVFGGYTTVAWDNTNCWKYDTDAFIFSLINPNEKIIKIDCIDPEHAIYCSPNYGPSFGIGRDIYICDEPDINPFSYSSLGFSYNSKDTDFKIIKYFLTGNFNFKIEEIEIFHRV